MQTEFHEHHLETELRDGVTRTILVITTDIPIPPKTHIDIDMLPVIVQKIRQIYVDSGRPFDDVRLVHRSADNA